LHIAIVAAAQQAILHRSQLNSAARRGKYHPAMKKKIEWETVSP
jgi:hypothetical protein